MYVTPKHNGFPHPLLLSNFKFHAITLSPLRLSHAFHSTTLNSRRTPNGRECLDYVIILTRIDIYSILNTKLELALILIRALE
jgi:hypothetical protein